MKTMPYLCSILSLFLSAAGADIITCRDGRKVEAIVMEETKTHLVVNLYGQKVEIPRSRILGVETVDAGRNTALEERWRALDREFKSSYPTPVTPAGQKYRPVTRLPFVTPRPTVTPTRTPRPEAARSRDTKSRRGADTSPREKSTNAHRARLNWNHKVRTAIYEKRVLIGMTKREVRRAWGWPERTHPVGGINITTDRWTYRRKDEGLVDCYFENGKLVRISR